VEIKTCSKFSTVTKCCFKISVAEINIVISAAEIKNVMDVHFKFYII
jgi:hypothetical protein